jgi:hypothetical protein
MKYPLALNFVLLFATTVQAAGVPTCSGVATSSSNVFVAPIGTQTSSGFVVDGLSKRSLSLSRDKSKIGYVKSSDQNGLYISDKTGFTERYTLLSSDYLVTRVDLVTPDLVRIERSAGKNASEFSFYRIPRSGTGMIVVGEPILASDCTISPDAAHTACYGDGKKLSIDNSVVFQVPLSAYSKYLGDFAVEKGSTGGIDGAPGITFDYIDTTNGGVNVVLHRSPDSSDSYGLKSGQAVVVDSGDNVYFFSAEPSADFSFLTMHVYSGDSTSNYESGLVAWSDDSQKVTLLRGNFIATFAVAGNGSWQQLSSAHIDSNLHANSAKFFSSNALFVRGPEGFYSVPMTDFSVEGSLLTAHQLPTAIRIPQQDGSTASVSAVDMSCD